MKRFVASFLIALAAVLVVHDLAEAKRLGGGGSAGMRRSVPTQTAPDGAPARPATPQSPTAPNQAAQAAPGAAAAAAQPARRSWMAPIAGLAAGLGLAALASHFGFGEQLANFMMLMLLGIAAIFVVRWLMRRFSGQNVSQPRMATPNGAPFGAAERSASMPLGGSSGAAAGSALAPAAALPADFDRAGFERIAKMIFIRLQAANDAADLDDLRRFTTPEMFAAVRLDLQERGAKAQRTDVVQIDAEVIDLAREHDQQVVSVRYHGLIREVEGGTAEPFDEVWHLVRPEDGSRDWAIAGIQQMAAA